MHLDNLLRSMAIAAALAIAVSGGAWAADEPTAGEETAPVETAPPADTDETAPATEGDEAGSDE